MEKQAENTTSPVLKSETGEVYGIPEGGSLGLLALGYVGLMLWREKRAKNRHQLVSPPTI